MSHPFIPTRRGRCWGCVLLLGALPSCHKDLTAEGVEKSPEAIAERGPSGTATWIVAPDGKVSATLKAPDGARVSTPVTGQLAFAATTPGAPPTMVPVTYDPKTGVLNATGPQLQADLTPVSYSLEANGTPWTGTLDIPKGGTLDLVETAKLQPPAPPMLAMPPSLPPPPSPPGLQAPQAQLVAPAPPGIAGLPPPPAPVLGPNGGVVETVGPDRVEVVGNRHTGDVRAYVLGPDGNPVDPGDRRITIALDDPRPEVLTLAPEPQGHFVVGHVEAHVEPVHVTVAVTRHGATHACLVGWQPASVVVVGPEAPRVHLFRVEAWPGEVVEVHGPHGHHHDYVEVEPGVVFEPPGVVVQAPGVFVAPPVVAGPGVVVEAPGVAVHAPGVVVGAPGVVVGAPGVVVGAPGVVVGGPPLPAPPGFVVGGPSVVVGGPGVMVGGGGVVHVGGGGHHEGDHDDHGGGRHKH